MLKFIYNPCVYITIPDLVYGEEILLSQNAIRLKHDNYFGYNATNVTEVVKMGRTGSFCWNLKIHQYWLCLKVGYQNLRRELLSISQTSRSFHQSTNTKT